MPKPRIEPNAVIPLTVLCEFCGRDILKLGVDTQRPAADPKVGIAMSAVMEHVFTCRIIRAAQVEKGAGVYVALCDPDEYEEEEDDNDNPDDDELELDDDR